LPGVIPPKRIPIRRIDVMSRRIGQLTRILSWF
jgi:hypothetical protein